MGYVPYQLVSRISSINSITISLGFPYNDFHHTGPKSRWEMLVFLKETQSLENLPKDCYTGRLPRSLLLMVQKSGVHQLRLVVYPNFYMRGFFHIPGGVFPDFVDPSTSSDDHSTAVTRFRHAPINVVIPMTARSRLILRDHLRHVGPILP